MIEYRAILTCLELVMYILHPQMTRYVKDILYKIFFWESHDTMGSMEIHLLMMRAMNQVVYW